MSAFTFRFTLKNTFFSAGEALGLWGPASPGTSLVDNTISPKQPAKKTPGVAIKSRALTRQPAFDRYGFEHLCSLEANGKIEYQEIHKAIVEHQRSQACALEALSVSETQNRSPKRGRGPEAGSEMEEWQRTRIYKKIKTGTSTSVSKTVTTTYRKERAARRSALQSSGSKSAGSYHGLSTVKRSSGIYGPGKGSKRTMKITAEDVRRSYLRYYRCRVYGGYTLE